MEEVHSNPDATVRTHGYVRFMAALRGRGAAGTLLWFVILAGLIMLLTLLANRCGDDDEAGRPIVDGVGFEVAVVES